MSEFDFENKRLDAAVLEMVELQQELSVEIGKEAESSPEQQQASITMALRRMAGVQRDINSVTEIARLEMDAIAQIRDKQLSPLTARFKALNDWVLMVTPLIRWGKRQSHDTPYGVFGVRKHAATVAVVDEKATLGWAMRETESGKFFEFRPTLKWAELKKSLSADESPETLPDGVERVEATVTPYVKVRP